MKPLPANMLSIARFCAIVSAVNRVIPRRAAASANRSRIRVPRPFPCALSATKKVTSAVSESGAASACVLAGS